MTEPPFPQAGEGIDLSDPACLYSAVDALVITSFESVVIREYIRWCSLDTDGGW